MDELHAFDRLVTRIYEIPLSPTCLRSVLAELTEWLDGDTCHLVGWGGHAGMPVLSETIGLNEGVGPEYAAYYATRDPRRQFALDHQVPGQLLACQEHFDERFVSRSEFYQDYLLPVGVHYMLGTTLLSDDRNLVQIAFQRYVGHGRFAQREIDWAGRLIPHLQRAMTLLIRDAATRVAADASIASLETVSLGVAAVDARGRMIVCNRLAESLVRDGAVLTLRDGTLRATVPTEAAALTSAIAAVSRQACAPRNLVLHSVPPRAESGRLSVTVMAVPEASRPQVNTGATALCLIAPLTGGRVASAGQLVELFGLSPAEARLLRALAQGAALESYAQECGVRLSTLKTQLKALFAKTGTHRQAELVRLALKIPAIRSRELPNGVPASRSKGMHRATT